MDITKELRIQNINIEYVMRIMYVSLSSLRNISISNSENILYPMQLRKYKFMKVKSK